MNTPTTSLIQQELQSASYDEALVAASMSLQIALLRGPIDSEIQSALSVVLTRMHRSV